MATPCYFPAEWEPQSGVLITWPHAHSDWSSNLPAIETFYCQLATAISQYEKLLIIVHDAAHESRVRTLLQDHGVSLSQCLFFQAPSNDTWTRDYGPLFVKSHGQWQCLDFEFNGWGNKYPSEKDNALTQKLWQAGIIKAGGYRTPGWVLEGGSIDSNGAGTIMTTRQCLLNPNRNPAMTTEEIEQALCRNFQVERIFWLSEGMIMGDDTDGHIDMLARFTGPGTILHSICDDSNDPHYLPLKRMQAELENFRSPAGQAFQLKALPVPAAIVDEQGHRLPASYANFLIINGAVLVPVYDDPHDEIAMNVLQSCFPSRTILPIDARPAIRQGGSLHCLTMQLPQGVL